MDVQQLCTVLQASMSPNTEEIKAAESILSSHETRPGHVQNLMRVAVEGSLDPGLTQAAAIGFKRVVEKRWEPREEGENGLLGEDKAEVRNNIVQAVVRTSPLVQKQFSEVLRIIIMSDFPDKWPGLKDIIVQSLHSTNEGEIYGGLVALRWVARKFEFKEEGRESLFAILDVTLAKICEFLKSLAIADNSSPGAAELLKVICKILWALTFSVIPKGLSQPSNFNALMESLLVLVGKELPMDQLPEDPKDQDAWCWWKVKKWILHLTVRFFRYHSRKEMSKPENEAFTNMYIDNVMVPMLEAHMRLLSRMMALPRPNERILTLLLNYMQYAVTHGPAFKILKEHAKPMLFSAAVPLMYFSSDDMELFVTDPHEFVRKGYDIMEDIYSAKTAAVNFAFELCKSKGKFVLADFVNHLGSIMARHDAAVKAGNVSAEIAGQMDGALLGLGSIADILKKKKAYKHNMEGLLVEYVVPCFLSQHGHLRARACWVLGNFADLKFKEGVGKGQTFGLLMQKVIVAMKDPELPVRIDSVVALKDFFDALENLDALKPILPELLSEFFKLMNEVDNEDMVCTLETIVEKFGDEIAPYAEGLALNLVAAFFKCMEANAADETEEDLGALAAFGCIRAINTLLDSVTNMPQIYLKLEDICFPILDKMLKDDALDIFEDLMEMMGYFLYFSPEISPRMWGLLPRLQHALLDWAGDFLEEMLMPLENYISKGKEAFLTCKNPDYLNSINQMIEHTMTNVDSETDLLPAPKLMEIVLQNCKGRVDQCVAPYLLLAAKKLQTAERSKTKVGLISVAANALFYNATLTLSIMQQRGLIETYMSKWFEMIFAAKNNEKWRFFRRLQDKKISILGLTALIAVPDASLTPELQDGLPQILSGIMKLLLALKEQEEKLAEASSSDEELEDESEEEDGNNGDNDDDDGTETSVDTEYIRRLHREARSMFGCDDDSDPDDFTDDEDADTPIDPIDPFKTFAETMGMLEKTNAARVQVLMTKLDAGSRDALQGMVKYAASRKEETNGTANGH